MTDETVALAATVSAFPAGVIDVRVDGMRPRPSFSVRTVSAQPGVPLLFAVGPRPRPGRTITMNSADGEMLARAVMPEPVRTTWLDIDALAAAVHAPGDRLVVFRQLADTGTFLLKLSDSGRFRDLRHKALDRAVELSEGCRVERAVRLDGNLILWVLRGVSVPAVEAVHLYRNRDLRLSPFRPVTLDMPREGEGGAVPGTAVLLTESEGDNADPGRLLIWGRQALWSPEPGRTRIDVRSGLHPLLQSLGEHAYQLVTYLAACLGPYLNSRPALRTLLAEVSAMCPPRPARTLHSDRPLGAGIDLVTVTDDGWLFAQGWTFDPLGLIEGVSWIHPTGRRVPLGESWVRIPGVAAPQEVRDRATRDEPSGFAAAVRGADSARLLPQQAFEVTLRSGGTFELVAPPGPREPVAARDAVLSIVSDGDFTEDLAARVVGPVAAALQREHLSGERIDREIVVGDLPPNPTVSLVIPIYKTLEFIRYQVAAFALDDELATAELVVVVDSPHQTDEIESRFRAFHALYGLPVRIVVHHRNLGYAPAINTGVSRSTGDLLVLMNSDVVPSSPGWSGVMASRLSGDAGAVGPKLLFHDDSIQHAGMAFERDLRGRYFNMHTYKGYPRMYAPAVRARRVPALTGACLMMRRSVFEDVGGVCEDYIVGDFEDSDLSFRIARSGRSLWYEPAAELYHYERQSIAQNDSYTTTRASGYNRWLHAQRWGHELDTLTGVHELATEGAVATGDGGPT